MLAWISSIKSITVVFALHSPLGPYWEKPLSYISISYSAAETVAAVEAVVRW